jgi:hypothetical protein
MKTPFHIEIPKRNSACSHQGEKFVPGMDYFSLISEDETKKIKRLDYCTACWKSLATHTDLAKSRNYWKSKIEHKDKSPPASRAERAMHLLKKLLESENPPESEIFVLVLLLAHMRRLILRKEWEENSLRYGLYEILNQDEFIKIKLVHLSLLETENIQQSLASQLNALATNGK